jgi:hypothetical protein
MASAGIAGSQRYEFEATIEPAVTIEFAVTIIDQFRV